MQYIYRARFGTVDKFVLVKETDKTVWYKIQSGFVRQERKDSDWLFFGKTFEEAKEKMLIAFKNGLEECVKEHIRTVRHFEEKIAKTLALTEE